MQPRIEIIPEKLLVGRQVTMTLADNKTGELFKGFMPRRHEIKNTANTNIICMQVFKSGFNFNDFDMHTPHQKWAAVEVDSIGPIPKNMESFILPGGLYAVFLYKGTPGEFAPMFNYIFNVWMPQSGYVVDNRPHFEILGDKYKNNHPDSEEEIWVPVKPKA